MAEREPGRRGLVSGIPFRERPAVEAILLARKGDRSGAEVAIGRTIHAGKGPGHSHHDEYGIGCAYSLMGEEKEAIACLKKSVADGLPSPLSGCPCLDPLRDNPEFQAFLMRRKNQCDSVRRSDTLSGGLD